MPSFAQVAAARVYLTLLGRDPSARDRLHSLSKWADSETIRAAAIETLAFGWQNEPLTRQLIELLATEDRAWYIRQTAARLLAERWADPAELAALARTGPEGFGPGGPQRGDPRAHRGMAECRHGRVAQVRGRHQPGRRPRRGRVRRRCPGRGRPVPRGVVARRSSCRPVADRMRREPGTPASAHRGAAGSRGQLAPRSGHRTVADRACRRRRTGGSQRRNPGAGHRLARGPGSAGRAQGDRRRCRGPGHGCAPGRHRGSSCVLAR